MQLMQKKHTPTPEMIDILTAVSQPKNNSVLVEALAGSGKTSTISLIIPKLQHKKILYLTYNKHIADDARVKLSCYPNVTVRTVHSLAYSSCGFHFQHKLGEINYADLKKLLETQGWKVTWSEIRDIKATVTNFFANASTSIGKEHIPKNTANEQKTLKAGKWLWEEMCNHASRVPMSHDGYFKLFCLKHWKDALESFDTLIVDESQDQTQAFVAVERLFWESGRQLIKVGDQSQQLFRYRGAIDANDAFKSDIDSFPLSTCFRFGPEIATSCETVLGLKGKKYNVRGNSAISTKIHPVGTRLSGDRTLIHRKAISVFYSAIELSDKPVNIKVVGGLENYITAELRHFEKLYFGQKNRVPKWFLDQFPNWLAVKSYVKETKDLDVKRVVSLLENMRTKGVKSLTDFIEKNLNQRVSRQDWDTIQLTTVHRFKGAESKKVVLSNDFPSLGELHRLAKPEFVDEINILYVALTRPQTDIVLNEVLQDILNDTTAIKRGVANKIPTQRSRYL